jgi:serine/threonine protein kinase
MLDPQASRFWQATLLSGLMDAQGLMACWQAIAPAKRDVPEHVDRRLARQAVQLKALTLWQAQQLLAGRTGGYKVDRYTLLDLIGQGGMGRVYLARDTRLNRMVALKILSPERVSNPRAIARFQREARVGAQLQHENLVRIYDFGESSSRFYLVMEYIEGKTIGTLIAEQGRIPPVSAVRLVRQVALGLEHAYRKGLIHRDVNPYNILVTRDGTAKLADLGLAIDLAEEDHVTREGATVGTFDYVAPEQARHSHAADIRSDIYSLGCTIYHMCAGHVPFPSPSLPEKLFAHQALEPTPLNQLVPGLPDGLADVVDRMMKKSPDERFATPMQVIHALDSYIDGPAPGENRDSAALLDQETMARVVEIRSPSADDLSVNLSPDPNALAGSDLPKTVAVLDGAERPPQTATETGSRGNADVVAKSLLSPPADNDAIDQGFPLIVDLGPEPSLGEGVGRMKPRSNADPLQSPISTRLERRPKASLLWGVVVLTTTAMVAVAVLALVRPFNSGPVEGTAAAYSGLDVKKRVKADTIVPKTIAKDEPAILVRADGESDQEFPAGRLYEALQTAIGARGWVELRNREPLSLTNAQPLNFSSGRGRLIIRAATGRQPVIDLSLTGSSPFLTTGSGVVLELSGLTINIRYAEMGAAAVAPAVISTAGSARIDRCAFQVKGEVSARGSHAIISNGGLLEINRSWFQGFDDAVSVITMNKTPAQIRQTMIVSSFRSGQPQEHASEWYGWAVKLQAGNRGGPRIGSPQPQVILERCTIDQDGLIDITESPGSSPLEVEIKDCVVKARAMLACKHSIPPAAQIRWQGAGNQYDILGPAWVVLSARQGTPAFTIAATDLQSWLVFATGDQHPSQEKLQFQPGSANQTTVNSPAAYKIQPGVTTQVKRGADPDLVGPWSAP